MGIALLKVLDPGSETLSTADLVEQEASYWEQSMSTELKDYHVLALFQWHSALIGHEVVVQAMQQTFEAPVPTWRYLTAIMNNCITDRCLSLEDWIKRNQVHSQKPTAFTHRQHASKTVSAQRYEQRDYTEAELNKGLSATIAKAARYDSPGIPVEV